jgi:hypothetical protein
MSYGVFASYFVIWDITPLGPAAFATTNHLKYQIYTAVKVGIFPNSCKVTAGGTYSSYSALKGLYMIPMATPYFHKTAETFYTVVYYRYRIEF